MTIRQFLPKEFDRKLRAVKDFEHYKAVEFRTIIMYLAPLLFKQYLPINFYEHLLLLHFSVYCFSSPVYCEKYFTQAEACVELFCQKLNALYGNKLQSYNCHILRHIPYFIKMYGPLDQWSSFTFENYNSILKRRLKCTNGMFKQTINNMYMIRDLFCNISVNQLHFSVKSPDNCCILDDNSIMIISDICTKENTLYVSGFVLQFVRDLDVTPYASSSLRVGYYRKTNKQKFGQLPVNKCICIPKCDKHDDYVIFPYVNPELVAQ